MKEVEFKEIQNSETDRTDTAEDSVSDNRLSAVEDFLGGAKVSVNLWRNRTFLQDIT